MSADTAWSKYCEGCLLVKLTNSPRDTCRSRGGIDVLTSTGLPHSRIPVTVLTVAREKTACRRKLSAGVHIDELIL